MGLFWVVWLLATAQGADTLRIYSEFRRVDARGEIVAADRGGKPREILSPGLIRGGYFSMRVVVTPKPNKHYALQVAENPENTVQLKLYRELPDKLEAVKATPYEWDGGPVQTFWFDLFTPANAKVERVRIEVQVHDGDGWNIYPMEVRVLPGIVPATKRNGVAQMPANASSDLPAKLALREYLCDDKPKTTPAGLNVTSFQYRNAQQDIALARTLQVKWTKEALADAMMKEGGWESAEAFCTSGTNGAPASNSGPEWYMKVRDFLNRAASF